MRRVYGAALLVLMLPWGVCANDFPTLARVEYVLECMQKQGGQNYDNLYKCACEVDVIAGVFVYDEFSEAYTFERLRRTPGERGSVFRDPPRSKALRNKLKSAREQAKKSCFSGGG